MCEENSILHKIKQFLEAFSEFLGRPKTVFDIKDRLQLIFILEAVIAVLEYCLYYLGQ